MARLESSVEASVAEAGGELSILMGKGSHGVWMHSQEYFKHLPREDVSAAVFGPNGHLLWSKGPLRPEALPSAAKIIARHAESGARPSVWINEEDGVPISAVQKTASGEVLMAGVIVVPTQSLFTEKIMRIEGFSSVVALPNGAVLSNLPLGRDAPTASKMSLADQLAKAKSQGPVHYEMVAGTKKELALKVAGVSGLAYAVEREEPSVPASALAMFAGAVACLLLSLAALATRGSGSMAREPVGASRDVSSESAALSSMEHCQSLTKTGSFALRSGRFENCSASFLAISGLLGPEPGFDEFLASLSKEDSERMSSAVEAALDGDKALNETVKVGRSWVRVMAELTGKGTLQGCVHDRTEDYLVSASERQMSARQKTAFDSIMEGLLIIAEGGVVEYSNATAERMLTEMGWNSSLGVFMAFAGRVFDERGNRLEIADFPSVRTMATGVATRGEVVGVDTESGGVKWFSISSTPLGQAESGRKVLTVMFDMTEAVEMRNKAQESEMFLRSVLDFATEAVFVSNGSWTPSYSNEAFKKLFGASAAGGIEGVLSEGSKMQFLRFEKSLMTTGEGRATLLADVAGGERMFDLSAARMPNGYTVCFCRDVTDEKNANDALTESERVFHSAFESAPTGVAMVSFAGIPIRLNEAAHGFLGSDDGSFAADFFAMASKVECEGPSGAEMDLTGIGGGSLVLRVHRSKTGSEKTGGFVVYTMEDVTFKQRAESSRRLYEEIFDSASEGIMVVGMNDEILEVNKAFTEITGHSKGFAVGKTPNILKSGRHGDDFYKKMRRSIALTGKWSGEIWNKRAGGDVYPQWASISTVNGKGGEPERLVAIFSDITEKKRQEADVWKKANFDDLTGLANRNLLRDKASVALTDEQDGRGVGMIFMDIDRFKELNDSKGHESGDRLLIDVSKRIESCCRREDTVARLGGDEFCILIPGARDKAELGLVAQKVMDALKRPFEVKGFMETVTASFGGVVSPADGSTFQDLVKRADMAMYAAKLAGKNRYCHFDMEQEREQVKRTILERELREAIPSNDLFLTYQAQTDADSGEIIGAEALVRWRKKDGTTVLPSDFIPVAEASGLIVPLGKWVLQEASKEWRRWEREGMGRLVMSVNVSGSQLREDGLSEFLEGVVGPEGFEKNRLMLEITESVIMEGWVESEARLRSLKKKGYAFSLDDFGTGYSSLSSLRNFPVDHVKIDKSFIDRCDSDSSSSSIVDAIIHMAKSLGMVVVAEGVETVPQLDFLRDRGCDLVQGYLVSKPVLAEEFLALARTGASFPHTKLELPNEKRLLSVIRGEGGLDEWLVAMVDERVVGMGRVFEQMGWVANGFNAKEAIDGHLSWRRDLREQIEGRSLSVKTRDATSHERCPLGVLMSAMTDEDKASPAFAAMDDAHRIFHMMAGEMVSDCLAERFDSAMRKFNGLPFRKASRDIVISVMTFFLLRQH